MDAQQATTVQLTAIDGSGDWIPSDQLCSSALAFLLQDVDVHVPLGSVEHLDASALQILLALAVGLQRKSRTLTLANSSAGLERWFHLAGATALLNRAQESQACAEAGR